LSTIKLKHYLATGSPSCWLYTKKRASARFIFPHLMSTCKCIKLVFGKTLATPFALTLPSYVVRPPHHEAKHSPHGRLSGWSPFDEFANLATTNITFFACRAGNFCKPWEYLE